MPPKRGTIEYERWRNSPQYELDLLKNSIGHKGIVRTKASRLKQSVSMSGKNNPNFGGKSVSGFQRNIASHQMMIQIIQNNGNGLRFGQHHTDETKQLLREQHLGKPLSLQHRKNIGNAECGEKNPRWIGGKSFEPYPITFNRAFKQFIREYYGNICINCHKSPEENGEKLTVHHYDYDKNSRKCVPACRSCNAVANANREYWEGHYTNLVIQFERDNDR